MDLQLNDKTALVTGATAGVGLAIARKLASEGAKVIIAGRTQAKLDEAVKSIRKACGFQVTGVMADPATSGGTATLVNAAPIVDILVNNLAIYEIKKFIDITDEDWRSTSRSMFSAEFGSRVHIFPACLRNSGAGSSSFPVNPALSRRDR